jgi:hypothetical protein
MSPESLSQTSRMNAARQASFSESLKETLEVSQTAATEITESKQDASQDTLRSEAEGNFTAAGIAKRSTKLEPRKEVKKSEKKDVKESVLVRKEDADSLADGFSQRQGNHEYRLDSRVLSQIVAEELGAGIHENSDPDTIIGLIRTRLMVDGQAPDVAFIDKAFEFLLEVSSIQLTKVTGADKERLKKIINKLEMAKNKHFDSNAIEIQVAQKIIGAVDAVATKTGQSVKETLDRYRDVVHNPPDLQTLRKFYEAKGYKAMVLELKGLNSYLGGNLKRANLENPELAQLAGAARKMQALLGVFRQSKSHVPTMESYLELNGILATAA